ncbi:sugar phosphate isomerase/epimerase family protein [Halobaculum sp. EA56]|uniref:sugar phosphate isomerase/epimerase family protein n=1 Tax=Halobaculum sp. EA56 TaxID=3421648 RepID=UPI003EBC43A2
MTSFAFQLYSLHAVDDPLTETLDRVGRTGFDGVEFAGLGDETASDVAAALADADLAAPSAHVDAAVLEGDPDGVADTYDTLGCDDLVVPWLDPDCFASRDAVADAAARLSALADRVSAAGATLHYHNHDQEFRAVDGEPALSHLLAETDDLRLQLDVGWAGAAGHDPVALLRRHADRIDSVHLKDYDAERGEVVEVGDGDLDVAAAVRAVRDLGIDWLVYEAEEDPGSYGTLDHAESIRERYW